MRSWANLWSIRFRRVPLTGYWALFWAGTVTEPWNLYLSMGNKPQ